MKRIQIIIPVLLGAFCTGCDLDIEPQDRYDQQTFWYSAKAAEGGLTGCYNALLENGIYGRAAVYWEDDATPNGYNFSNDDSWTTIANGAQTATSGGIIANRWSHAYKGIGRCNTLLDNIDLNRELDKSVIEEYKNQARFLRVLFYYMLTTYYGDCPLITTTPAMEHKSLPRTPRTEVVSFMLGELEQLSKVLPPKAEPGRPTSGAALALKARILLFEASPLLNPGHDDQKWREAADAARAVMDCDSDYQLFTAPGQIGSAYRNLFLESGENSSECIFSVQCMNQNKLGLSFELIARQYGDDGAAARPHRLLLRPRRQCPHSRRTAARSLENRPALRRHDRLPGLQVHGLDGHGDAVPANRMHDQKVHGLRRTHAYGRREKHRRYRIAYRLHDPALRRYPADVRRSQKRIERAGRDGMERNGAPRSAPGQDSQPSRRSNSPERIRRNCAPSSATSAARSSSAKATITTTCAAGREAENVNNGPIRKFNNDVILVRSFEPSRDYWWPVPQGEIDLNRNLLPNNPNY